MNNSDIEAYVFGDEVGPIISVIENELRSLEFDGLIDENRSIYSWGDTKIIVTKGIECGFISVWICGKSAWDSDMDFALFLSESLNKCVRCDPGDTYPEVSPYSNIFAEIYEGNISLVRWG
jgi:hypothetical protein